ncbi:MAG: helix-turn-helix transcriptional regulator [Phascolarctobacterium sp.]|nr:helix-turn-helix transcriptional regulator [Phascolarctobacterium sp.]
MAEEALSHEKTRKELGAVLRNIRLCSNLSQKKVADAIGVDRATISKWERGENYINQEAYLRMCEIYKINPGLPYYLMNDATRQEFIKTYPLLKSGKEIFDPIRLRADKKPYKRKKSNPQGATQ